MNPIDDSSPDVLIASCWTTAGPASPLDADQRSPIPFASRVEITADAGFGGFGITHADIVELDNSIGLVEARDILRDNGIQFVELEMLMDWFTDGTSRDYSNIVRRELLAAAGTLPVRHLKVGTTYGTTPWPVTVIARELRHLAGEAADVGARIALEPQAMANIRSPNDALEVIELADHPAAGLLLDIWHLERIEFPMDGLRGIPPEVIVSTELNDAPARVHGSLLEDTVNGRQYCGEGSFDVAGFIEAVRATGYRGPWGVEILSHAHRARPVEEAIQHAYTTTRLALGASRSEVG